jgi:N-carbamoylputrescine amidase
MRACASGDAIVKIAICELPTNLSRHHPAWPDFMRRLEHDRPDLLLLNEMPFGAWLASDRTFDADRATASVDAHDSALRSLRKLKTAVLGSRPIQGREKLCNEAFLLAGGVYRPIHHKQYFPQEEGFFEESWFAAERRGFDVIEYRGIRIGVLLCTELMFTEWARHYRRQGAHVIVSPRASSMSGGHWDTAARMAAVISGCYVLSSNRMSASRGSGPFFGGRGFAYSPTGELLAETTPVAPVVCVNIDVAQVAEAQQNYPCYVREL